MRKQRRAACGGRPLYFRNVLPACYPFSCFSIIFFTWSNDYLGFSNTGSFPACNSYEICDSSISVEDRSWGAVKGIYR